MRLAERRFCVSTLFSPRDRRRPRDCCQRGLRPTGAAGSALLTHLTVGTLPSSEDSTTFAVSGERRQTRLQDYTTISA